MTDKEILAVYNELRGANWLPASSLGSVRDDLEGLFTAYPGQEEAALRAGLGYVAASEFWQGLERVTLKSIANKNKLVRYAEMHGLGEHTESFTSPSEVEERLAATKSSEEIEAVLRVVRPDVTQAVWIGDVPYAVKFVFDEPFILRNPGRWRILRAHLIKAGDMVSYLGDLCIVERVVKYDLVGVDHNGHVQLVTSQTLEI